MSFVYEQIRNVCIFSLLITLILNIFPEESNKKYIKLFAGFLMIAIVFQPISKIKGLNIKLDRWIGDYDEIRTDTEFNNRVNEMESKLYEGVSRYYQENEQDSE